MRCRIKVAVPDFLLIILLSCLVRGTGVWNRQIMQGHVYNAGQKTGRVLLYHVYKHFSKCEDLIDST